MGLQHLMRAIKMQRGLQSLALASHLEIPMGWDKVLEKVKIISTNNGKCVAELTLDSEHINMHGGIHGGLTASIINNMCKYALLSKSSRDSGDPIDMQVLYMSAPKIGENLLITADTVRIDDKTAFIECEIRTKANNMLVAKGSQTKFV